MYPNIQNAILQLQSGGMIVVTDHPDRENEGDLIMAAQFATQESIHFMAKEGRGLICAPLSSERARQLNLNLMVSTRDAYGTAFTQSVDHVDSGTGISAAARAMTAKALANSAVTAESFVRPGHLFPLIAKPGGVLERPGHTEASIDLMTLAGLEPVAIICEILDEDGQMARGKRLSDFAKLHQLPQISLEELIQYQQHVQSSPPIKLIAQSQLPTDYGDFTLSIYENPITSEHHPVLSSKKISDTPLVRIHSECLTGDTFGSHRCDCGEQLQQALSQISEAGGHLIYLRQEGRGIGLANKIRAYALQEAGADTAEANRMLGLPEDCRDYKIAADILKHLKAHRIHLLTNNPDKEKALHQSGIEILSIQRIYGTVRPANRRYLQTKQDHFHHHLSLNQ